MIFNPEFSYPSFIGIPEDPSQYLLHLHSEKLAFPQRSPNQEYMFSLCKEVLGGESPPCKISSVKVCQKITCLLLPPAQNYIYIVIVGLEAGTTI